MTRGRLALAQWVVPASCGIVIGPGCVARPGGGTGASTAGASSVATRVPVTTRPSTLVSAVQAAGLVDTLNSARTSRSSRPSNDAFAKVAGYGLDAARPTPSTR